MFNPPKVKVIGGKVTVLKVRTLLRVSSQKQLYDDDIPLQRAELKDFINKNPDWIFDGEYMEAAVSGYKNTLQDREKLLQILDDAKKGEFDILLAYMSDRIGRREEYTTYISMLNNLGIQVWTVKEGKLNTDSHIDSLMNFIRFWQNEGESRKTSARVRDALLERAKAGKFNGGYAPFGYALIPTDEINAKGRIVHKLQIIEKDAEVVKKIFNYAVNQGLGYQRIANALEAEEIKSPTGKNKWICSTLNSILTNPIYMGYVVFNRRNSHGKHRRVDSSEWILSDVQVPEYTIVLPEIWYKAQEIRESRKNKLSKRQKENSDAWEAKYSYPFSTKGQLALIDLLFCGYCGKPLKNTSYCNRWSTKKTGEEKMKFTGRYTCVEEHEGRHGYSQNYIEGIVFEVVGKYINQLKEIDVSDNIIQMYRDRQNLCENKIKRLRKEQQKVSNDIAILEEYIPKALRGDAPFPTEKLSQLLKENEKKLEHLKKCEEAEMEKISNIEFDKTEVEKLSAVLPNWKEEFESADISTKHMLLATIIDKIEVKDDDVKIIFKIRFDDFIKDNNESKNDCNRGTICSDCDKNDTENNRKSLQETIDQTVPITRL